MDVGTFIHQDGSAPTTLSEIKRMNDLVAPSDFIGMYAYATQSGFASFNLELGSEFWSHTPTRWLFGFDYGRTQPQAIRSILQQENVNVRIVDGAWVVGREGFLPRRDFHAKLALMLNPNGDRYGMVVGSGNYSSNGLRKSIEAGAALYAVGAEEFSSGMAVSVDAANALWEQATPAEDILDAYEEVWLNSFSRRGGIGDEGVGADAGNVEAFWIEAGYVTKNRGPNRPGNQIDLPRGMSRYFGFNPPDNQPINSVIGPVTFQPPAGEGVTRNLRFGNNHMEKITLPTPEAHGYDVYDGKVLLFRRAAHHFVMDALEAADFEAAFGDRLSSVKVMGSGRRYGRIG